MALRTQNKNPYLIGGNPTGSAYAPVSYGDFVENPKTTVASTPSITYAQGTNNYGAGTGNYITPSQTVDTTYAQALGAVMPTPTPTQDSTPYNGGGGTINLNTQTGEYAKVMPTAEPSVNPSASLPQYYESMRQQAIAQADKDRLQANINAKGQYNEFINPYGVQAEQQARMGFTGGGYSEYLKGKAYEGMLNTQNQAQAQYAQAVQGAENTYNANMATYNEGLKAKEEAKAQDLAQGKVNMNAAMDGMVDGVNNTSWEALAAYGKQQGLTDEELATYKTQWDSMQTTAKNEDALASMDGWTDADWDNALKDETYNSYTPEQQEIVNAGFSNRIAQASGYDANTGATTTYFTENGKQLNAESAKAEYEEAMNDTKLAPELKEAIKKEYQNRFMRGLDEETYELIEKAKSFDSAVNISDKGKIVDPNARTYTSKDFGKFNDTGKEGSGQENLISAIVSDAKAGKIKDGQIVLVNYGKNEGETEAFMYVSGKFVKVGDLKRVHGLDTDKDIYVPSGYEVSAKYKDDETLTTPAGTTYKPAETNYRITKKKK